MVITHPVSCPGIICVHLGVVVDVYDSLLPLASRNLALEEDIDFAVGPTLHLRKVEVCRQEANETSRAPDVSASAAEVDALESLSAICHCNFGEKESYQWVEHVSGEEDARNVDDVVGTAPDARCKRPQTNG